MTLSMSEIEEVVQDLKPRLEGGRIERIDQPEPEHLILTIRNRGELYWLLLCAHRRFSRLHLLTTRPEQGEPAAGFCNAVRQHLTGSPVVRLRQVPRDRIVVIESSERDKLRRPHEACLVAELMGVGSNLILLDEDDRVLASLVREDSDRRRVVPGAPYEPPQAPEELPEAAFRNRFAGKSDPDDPLALSRAIQARYAEEEVEQRLDAVREEVAGPVREAERRLERRLRKIEQQQERAEKAETWRRKGELLKIALPELRKGRREVVVEDLFEPERPEVTIELDPALSPTENMRSYFERYKKALAAREQLAERELNTRERLRRVRELAQEVEAAESVEALNRLKEKSRRAGVLFPEDRPERPPEGRRGPRRFESADGIEILVARNKRENDRLTFTIAHGNDYWLHVRGWPGPHVVVRTPEDDLPQETLLDAAHLAIHYSRIRGTDYAEVAYTQVKHVRRLKGAPEGRVSYSNESVLPVRFERSRLERLMRSGEARAGRNGA